MERPPTRKKYQQCGDFQRTYQNNSRHLIVPVDYANNAFQKLATLNRSIEQVNWSAFETFG